MNAMHTSIMSGIAMHGRCSTCLLTPSRLSSKGKEAHEVIRPIGHEPHIPGRGGEGVWRVYGAPALRHFRIFDGSA